MLVRRKSACKTSAGSSKILRWLTPLLGPNLDPKTGPKQRPKRRNENVILFWTPFWAPCLDPKMGSAIGEFRCCPHMLCKQICDPAAWTWMSTHTFFSLCVPSPVATVCWMFCVASFDAREVEATETTVRKCHVLEHMRSLHRIRKFTFGPLPFLLQTSHFDFVFPPPPPEVLLLEPPTHTSTVTYPISLCCLVALWGVTIVEIEVTLHITDPLVLTSVQTWTQHWHHA